MCGDATTCGFNRRFVACENIHNVMLKLPKEYYATLYKKFHTHTGEILRHWHLSLGGGMMGDFLFLLYFSSVLQWTCITFIVLIKRKRICKCYPHTYS